MRIHHLHVQHRIHAHLHIVAGDADLFGNIDRDFLEAVLVGDPLHERHENMKTGRQGTTVLPRCSITNALCCGTTTAVLAITTTISMAMTMKA